MSDNSKNKPNNANAFFSDLKKKADDVLKETKDELVSKVADTISESGSEAIKKIGDAGADAIKNLGKSGAKAVNSISKSIQKAELSEKLADAVENANEATKKLFGELQDQKKQIEEKGFSESAIQTTQTLVAKLASLSIVRVDREDFLRKTFGKSKYIDKILADGPQSVFTIDLLKEKADEIIKNTTRKTAAASFASGLPSNLAVAVATGSADIIQFFAFALNLAQKISYLFGEDDIFKYANFGADLIRKDGTYVPEDAQVRMISYLGGMMGVNGAASLIVKTSQKAGANIGKKVAAQALTKTAWYPLLKKVCSYLGYKITKKTVESAINKTVPIFGGIISGGLTYATFKPMGTRLVDVFTKMLNGEYDIDMDKNINEAFARSIEEIDRELDEDIIEGEYEEIIETEE